MRPATAVRIRRILIQLEALSRERSDWRVHARGVDLGRWEDLDPTWEEWGAKVRLGLGTGPARRTLIVSSMSERCGSVRIGFERAAGQWPDAIEVEDGDCGEQECPSGAFKAAVLDWVRRSVPPSWRVRAAAPVDLTRSLSRSCVRVLASGQGRALYVGAAGPSSPGADADSALTQILLWVSAERPGDPSPAAARLRVLVPDEAVRLVAHRARLLDPALADLEVWQYRRESWELEAPQRAGPPPAPVEDSDFRWPALGPFRWSSVLGRVIDLAPALVRRYPKFSDHDSLRIHGLEFARVLGVGRDQVTFGLAGRQQELTDANFSELERLVREIVYFRRPDSPNVRHPYYRVQAERWLEDEILENVSGLFPELEPGAVYPQIPVYLGHEPGRVDLLGADSDGRLVVMELKVKEDPGLPLQALDYWGRVQAHDRAGDFERRGYFGQRTVRGRPPKAYLVAPIFSFHDSTERIAAYLDPVVEVWKIGINEDWRCGIRVLRREKLRSGRSC